MKNTLTGKDIKAISANILFLFDEVCRRNRIVYSVFYGTLLGAVRHSGFIPWDDDIDIVMIRSEYEKLKKIVTAGDPFGGKLKLMNISFTPGFTAPLPKLIDTNTVLYQNGHSEKAVLGVYVDIFVFDKVPDASARRRPLFKWQDFLQRVWAFAEMRPRADEHNLFKKGVKKILNHGFARWIGALMEWNAVRCNKRNKNSSFYSNLLYCVYGRERETFHEKELTRTQDFAFEGRCAAGSVEYDSILRRLYGKYMELPPVEKRISNHDFVAYWK